MSGRNPTPVMKRTSKWMKREEENPRLPGFVYTPEEQRDGGAKLALEGEGGLFFQ